MRNTDMRTMMQAARDLRDQGHGSIVSYSRKDFLQLNRLVRYFCHY